MKKVLLSQFFLLVLLLTNNVFAAPKLCIDPGHGGSDPGAVSYVEEADIVLDTSLKLKNWLNIDTQDTAGGSSWQVIMTRSTDVYVSLSSRVNYANSNGASRFLSIHANAASASSAHGSETFAYYNGSSNSFDLRNLTQEELIAHGGLRNRGNKTAGYYVLKYTNMPAALTELGFVTNYSDSQSLNSSSWRNNVAKGFLHAFQRHYGYSAYTPSEHVTKIVDDSNSGFSASSSWYRATWSSSKYGDSYRYRYTGSESDAATWTVSVPSAGTYAIYAWWVSWSNRATAAPYIIYHSSGSSVVYADQTANGGKWNYLGSYYLNAGTNNVKLSCWTSSGTLVTADAIKWYK